VSRFGCVLVEHFDAAAVERCEPALREHPLAVVAAVVGEPNGERDRATAAKRSAAPTATVKTIIDANPGAREQGVRPRMTETEARARCPVLVTRPWVEESALSARHALLEAALALFREKTPGAREPVRLIGLAASGFGAQELLFSSPAEERGTRLEGAVDRVRERFGAAALKRGTVLASSRARKDRKGTEGG